MFLQRTFRALNKVCNYEIDGQVLYYVVRVFIKEEDDDVMRGMKLYTIIERPVGENSNGVKRLARTFMLLTYMLARNFLRLHPSPLSLGVSTMS